MRGPPTVEARRRHRSRQRESILDWLRESASHPTAAEIHAALLPRFPRLSVGTVYRNLDLLVCDGEIEIVRGAGAPLRYDGNPTPHHHFICERCGRICDLELPTPPSLARRLQRDHGLSVRRTRIEFTGPCPACADTGPGGGAKRPSNHPSE